MLESVRVGLRIYKILKPVYKPLSQNREKRLLVLSCMSVRLSARTVQLGSHSTDLTLIVLMWRIG